MSSFPHVLCFGRDPWLLHTREMVLKQRFETATVSSVDDLRRLAASEAAFDLVILCHTLSVGDCELAAGVARKRWADVKILALESSGLPSVARNYDKVVRGLDGPQALLETAVLMVNQA